MNLPEVLMDEAKKLGYTEEDVQRARRHADTFVGQGKEAKEALDIDLTEEEAEAIRSHIRKTLIMGQLDPGIKKQIEKKLKKQMELN